MAELIYCGTERVSATGTQALLSGPFAAVWSPPMLRRVSPASDDRLWLVWRPSSQPTSWLLGVGYLICPSPQNCDWTNSTAPGIVDAARAHGYGGPTNMAFLRLRDVRIFDQPPATALGDLHAGLNLGSAEQVDALLQSMESDLVAPSPGVGNQADATRLVLHPLFQLLRELEAASIPFVLAREREDTIRITIRFVGERVEVDVFEHGHMEVSRFPGSEDVVGDADLVRQLIDLHRE